MGQPIRILVWHGSRGEGARLTEIYHEVSRALAGAPGLLGNELLRSASRVLQPRLALHGVSVELQLAVGKRTGARNDRCQR